MPYQSFESLEVWKRACRLAKSVYAALGDCKDFGLKDQMTRAAVSIPSNIAEGYERGTNKDFIRFLKIAQGSAAELRTQAYIADSVELIDHDAMCHIVEECKGIGAMLQALAKARSNKVSEIDLSEAEGEAVDLAFDSPETGNRKPEPDASREAEGEAFELDFDLPETRNQKRETDAFEVDLPEPRNPKPETDL